MAHLSISLLGTFHVTLAGEPLVTFGYDKVRALLAYLVMEADKPHSRESLAALLWPDEPPKAARHSLSQALLKLRQTLREKEGDGGFLHVTRETICFNPDSDYDLDVMAFIADLDDCEAHLHTDPETCRFCTSRMEDAVARYRGEFLRDLSLEDSVMFEEWAIVHRERLHRRVLTVLYHLTRCYIYRGEYAQAQRHALQQVELEPYREEAHRQLMNILARSGQRSAALAQYETCRRILAEALGVKPDRETQALYRRIRSAGEARPHNLPAALTPLIGRERELARITRWLASSDCRLLTLVGLGGIGKTRLALEAAREHIGIYLHGVFFVPLTALESASTLPSHIVKSLGLTPAGDPKAQFLDYLRDKDLLLVLDNFEHLLDGVPLLVEILESAPYVHLLVTSRERLNLRAEQVLHVDGLPYPPTEAGDDLEAYDAVRLFVGNARRVQSRFALSEANRSHVARICRLVDGAPLALELVAAWSGIHTPAQIAQEIGSNLDFAMTTMRDVPARHRSLRAVFEHTWALLTPDEQRALTRLSVFRDGFDARAARKVAGATARILAALVDKSLLHRDATGRYDMHALVTQYAAERLAATPVEREAAEAAHGRYYTAFLREREAALRGRVQQAAWDEISAEMDNVRAAWAWAASQRQFEIIDQTLVSLSTFCWGRSWLQEGVDALTQATQALAASGPEHETLQARVQCHQAEFHGWLGEYQKAASLLEAGLPVLRAKGALEHLAYALNVQGVLAYWQGEYAVARSAYQESLAMYRDLGDAHGMAQSLNALANVTCDETGNYEQARALYAESLKFARQIGDAYGIARALINQGMLAQELGDHQEARRLYGESLRLYRQIGYRHGVGAALNALASIANISGEHETAQSLLQESLELNREMGNRRAVADTLKHLGGTLSKTGHLDKARQALAESLEICLDIHAPHLALDVLLYAATLYRAQGRLEEALELLSLVAHYPGVGRELETRARSLLDEWRSDLPAETVRSCLARGKKKTLESALEELRA
ncbi:MAG: tetratricopeptide repeat protein [Chloroflexi bacterium]|nr:tetratricopeptide repeat protein [Chloroflexota bacterium]